LSVLLFFIILFFLIFTFLNSFIFYQICHSCLNIHDAATIGVVREAYHYTTGWNAGEKPGVKEFRQAQIVFQLLFLDCFAESLSFDILESHFLEDLVCFPHQISHTCLLAVAFDHCVCSLGCEVDLFMHVFRNACAFYTAVDNVPFENLFFFVGRVPSDLNSLKSVQQRRENGLKTIGCANEKHIGQVNFQINKVILKSGILNGVQDLHDHILKAGSSCSALNLVDFVQENDRILSFGFMNGIKDLAWVCANISLSVPFHDGSIILTSKRNSSIWTIKAFCDGLDNTGLSNSRRAVEEKHLG
jgi:hypothetical protein